MDSVRFCPECGQIGVHYCKGGMMPEDWDLCATCGGIYNMMIHYEGYNPSHPFVPVTEGNPTVEEARADVIGSMSALFMQIKLGGYRGQTVPTLPEIYVEAVDALIEAVRQEERERVERVSRVEVIDYRRDPARCYAEWGVGAELAYQDEGRTLKVFVRARPDGA